MLQVSKKSAVTTVGDLIGHVLITDQHHPSSSLVFRDVPDFANLDPGPPERVSYPAAKHGPQWYACQTENSVSCKTEMSVTLYPFYRQRGGGKSSAQLGRDGAGVCCSCRSLSIEHTFPVRAALILSGECSPQNQSSLPGPTSQHCCAGVRFPPHELRGPRANPAVWS